MTDTTGGKRAATTDAEEDPASPRDTGGGAASPFEHPQEEKQNKPLWIQSGDNNVKQPPSPCRVSSRSDPTSKPDREHPRAGKQEQNRKGSCTELTPNLQQQQDNSESSVEPLEYDVLAGRGGKSNNHQGNKEFRDVVARFKALFKYIEKKYRKKLAEAIVSSFEKQDPPTRFLTLDEKTGRYYLMEETAKVKKVSQALREKKNGANEENPTINSLVDPSSWEFRIGLLPPLFKCLQHCQQHRMNSTKSEKQQQKSTKTEAPKKNAQKLAKKRNNNRKVKGGASSKKQGSITTRKAGQAISEKSIARQSLVTKNTTDALVLEGIVMQPPVSPCSEVLCSLGILTQAHRPPPESVEVSSPLPTAITDPDDVFAGVFEHDIFAMSPSEVEELSLPTPDLDILLDEQRTGFAAHQEPVLPSRYTSGDDDAYSIATLQNHEDIMDCIDLATETPFFGGIGRRWDDDSGTMM
mmetsp:Transcript_22613/g.52182  ORF Transcript_22613/g.52182 Transcript_22613/m.52182 type:complete len:467 (+) Transcript_22613:3130-4530(+)